MIKHFIGVDWGDPKNQSRSVALVYKVEDDQIIGVVGEFELSGREVVKIRDMGLPKDFVLELEDTT